MKPVGTHLLADLWGAGRDILDDIPALCAAMTEAASSAGLHVLETRFHKFAPQGVTGYVMLSESHISIHTWPESGTAALDVFTCGDRRAGQRACLGIIERLGAPQHRISVHERGGLAPVVRVSADAGAATDPPGSSGMEG
jgi:S-adenosylmethionine decarboxylase